MTTSFSANITLNLISVSSKMSAMPQVKRIPINEWAELRDLFKSDLLNNLLPYHLIQNYLDWHKKDPEFVEENIEINCLNGDFSDGTFYALDAHSLFFYTLNDDHEKLMTLLSLLPQEREYLGSCIYERHLPVVQKVLARIPNWDIKFDTMTHLHYLPKERAAAFNLDIPDGITLKPMHSDEHVATVDSVYPFKTEGVTAVGFKKLMRFNINLGAFTSEDKLVAWCLVYQSGVLNALQVLDDGQKRKGLGTLLVKAMAKEFADKDWDTFGCIVDGNLPSMNLFKKLGFAIIDQVHWVGFGSKDVNGTVL